MYLATGRQGAKGHTMVANDLHTGDEFIPRKMTVCSTSSPRLRHLRNSLTGHCVQARRNEDMCSGFDDGGRIVGKPEVIARFGPPRESLPVCS